MALVVILDSMVAFSVLYVEVASFVPIDVVTVEAKLGSLPRAVANSFKVSRVSALPFINSPIAVFTNWVVAIWVVFVVLTGVGAIGIPLKLGEFFGAFDEVKVAISASNAVSLFCNKTTFASNWVSLACSADMC